MFDSPVTINSTPVAQTSPLVIAVKPTCVGLPFWVCALACSPPVLIVLVLFAVAAFNPGPRADKIMRGLPTVCFTLFFVAGAFVIMFWTFMRAGANPIYSLEHDADIISPDSEVALQISSIWTSVFGLPGSASFIEALSLEGVDIARQPIFLALGAKEIPKSEDLPTEPEIVSPSQNFEKSHAVLLLGLIGVILLFAGLTAVPALRLYAPGRGYILIALVILVRWMWATLINVKYLRLAPGMIEVLHYRWFANTPRVRSYPVAPGTLVVLQHPTMGSRLLLSRGEQEDRISFSGVYDAKPIVERIWRAVRSTLPTPPLSRQELLG